MIRPPLFFAVTLIGLMAPGALAQDPAQRAAPVTVRELFDPQAFQTLVNPDCSHCVDEAKARSGELEENDRILAWIRGQYQGGGIPLRFFLVPYRVISDTYGVFVYDSDAGFVRGFEPSLDFTFHGWRNGIMVIKHKDGTLYSTLSGLAFAGPRKGETLKPVATIETDWGYWKAAYPGSVAYRMFEKYQPLDLPDEVNPGSVITRPPPDPRLEPQAEVIGLSLGDHAKAWPIAALEESDGLLTDRLDGRSIVVLWYAPTRTAAIYSTEVEDSEEPASVTLEVDGKPGPAPFVDRQTQSRWGIEGRAVEGPLKGKTLRWLPAVQCRWFAWAAEYPDSQILESSDGPESTASPDGPSPNSQSPDGNGPPPSDLKDEQPASEQPAGAEQGQSNARQAGAPFQAVIVQPTALTAAAAAQWRREGYGAAAVVLDELHEAADYQSAADAAAAEDLQLYYWIEIARCPAMAREHPEWMASLGLHEDWQSRFPGVSIPTEGQVAKAFPWVTIGYAEAFDAHLARVRELLARARGDYRGLLLNDLQGGPASCGCGNLQCRWAIDYGVPSTGKKLPGDDLAGRFMAAVGRLVTDKQVIPVWMTECEERDLPASQAPGARTTGHCGSVECSRGTCPKAFTRQWNALRQQHQGPIAILALHGELQRQQPPSGGPAWVRQALDYLDQTVGAHGGQAIDRTNLWVVVQGYGLADADVLAARRAALESNTAAILVALTPLDQSYLPTVIDAPGQH